MLVKSSKLIMAFALTSVLGLTVWAQAPQKNYKDRAEYDLYSSILKEANPTQKLALLNQWKEKYATTDFKEERMQLYLDTYRGLNQGAKVLETAKEMVAADPKSASGLLWINLMTVAMGDASPAALDTGEQGANSLLASLDTIFAAEKKPAALNDDQWKKERSNIEAIAHTTLGWVNWQRKKMPDAEAEFKKVIGIDPTKAQVSYWMGTVVLAQRNPETQAQALYYFARAANYEGANALDPATRKQIQTYLEKIYTNFHGDKSGLDEIIARAKTDPMPPADFKIKSSAALAAEKEEEFKKSNPMLALWMSIKKELAGPNGPQYFTDSVKDHAIPGGANGVTKFKATVISMTPATRPKEVVVAIADATTPEATLKFETPLASKADPGTVIEFEGTPVAFAPDPFNVTFDVEKEKLSGWPAAAPAAKKSAGAARKGVSKKK
ncbi:MAG: hypothetical protein ABI693_16045 [Bryobacteraceae bacterium]